MMYGMQDDYRQFLANKIAPTPNSGIDIDPSTINPKLFPFQRDITRWSLRKGRACIFGDCGLGKTPMQLEWARLTGGRTLILAPLSVARQTVREAAKFDVPVVYARSHDEAGGHEIVITNYEMVDHFDAAEFDAVVLDESSILKSFDGKTRTTLIERFANTPMRLCCTATPAPNDISEIANHAEFLGLMTRTEMLSAYFVHDDTGWRLKGHAREAFYRWLASWSMSLRKPSDIGYSDEGYDLPALSIKPLIVETDYRPEGQMFHTKLRGITDRSAVRRDTLDARVQAAAKVIAEGEGQWIAWVGLNDEGRELSRYVDDAVLVEGQQTPDEKADALERFIARNVRVLITKPSIAGFGMNLQNCASMVFVGLSDSYESYYQSVRRCWRFGQTNPVTAYIVLSDAEQEVYQNVLRKEEEANRLASELTRNVAEFEKAEIGHVSQHASYVPQLRMTLPDGSDGDANVIEQAFGKQWSFYNADSVEALVGLKDDSIDLSIYSPPFASLYTYSPSERDLGNSSSDAQFFEHYGMIIRQILRVTKPGRVTAVHVADIAAMLARDGYIGLKDFSGDVIRAYVAAGWTFDARIPIDKNQQAQSIRTHSKALTMTQLEKDRTWNRPALPDYILKFRKPGLNAVPVAGGDVSRDLWIEWANPTWPGEGDRAVDGGAWATWYGISEQDTLNAAEARSNEDERHICPLQLGTIERCMRLWSNEGDLVLDPFGGIASTGYVALNRNRRFVGIELKPEYWAVGVRNLRRAESSTKTLFDLMDDTP